MCNKVANPRKSEESEKLFENYLDLEGHSGAYRFEPCIPGKNTKPDYLLTWRNMALFFEVKMIAKPKRLAYGTGQIEPYKAIRYKIEKARKQFQEYKNERCSLVLYDDSEWTRTWLTPLIVFGAMLGDLGRDDKGRLLFLQEGGKMIPSYKNQNWHNTRINAIVILQDSTERVVSSAKFFEKAADQPIQGSTKVVPRWDLITETEESCPQRIQGPRVKVCVNPGTPDNWGFPPDLFRGPYDEHWIIKDGQLSRRYVGEKRHEIELAWGDFSRDIAYNR